MNYFEQELRKLFGHRPDFSGATYVGRACFARLGGETRARIEFVTLGTMDHYEALRVTALNRKDGPVDTLTLRFSDLLGKQQISGRQIDPHIWRYNEKYEWYGYKPTAADYRTLTGAVEDYLELFREPEQRMDSIPQMGQQSY